MSSLSTVTNLFVVFVRNSSKERRSSDPPASLAARPSGAMTTRSCWGCGTSLCPPKLPSGADAPRFKCTWCLAVNEPAFVFPNRRRSRRARMKTRWRQLEVVFARWGGRALAVAVVLTTLSVAWAQIAHLAPAVAGDSRAAKGAIVAATLFFLGNIFFNYALCSARRAGVVEDAPRPAAFRESWPPRNLHNGKDAIADALANAPGFDPARGRDDGGAVGDGAFEIPRGAFAGCVPCAPCQAAKPPGAHHCSTCRQCVQAMDHHCPFVANCVGADTMRHFLLFVGYVALGNLHGVCLCFLAARERGGIGPAGGAVAAFLDALGSKQRFRHGWDDAAETTRAGTGAVFGSKTLSRFLGPPPAFTAKALLRSGSPRGAVSLAVHGAYFAARGVSRVVAAAFDEAPDWVGWWAWQLCAGGTICVATSLLFWATLRGVAAGETYVESLKRKQKGSGDVVATRFGTGADDPGFGNASLASASPLKRSLLNRLERACPPAVRDGFDCLTCGCVTGSAGPAPWSRIGAFHLRQVFGSGPVWAWGAPLAEPPAGARNGAGTNKKGK